MALDHSPAAAPPCSWRIGAADVMFLLVALIAMRGAGQALLDDPGLGWHLRNIDAMRAHGWWLATDPFTEPDPSGPRTHLTNQWLGELPYWFGWRFAGMEGIAAVNAVIVGFMASLFYRYLRADGLPWPVAVLWTMLIAFGTACSWPARPNVFTILFVMMVARMCVLFHEGRVSWRGLAWLIPLFAIWANTHGGFMAGLITLGATTAVELGISVGAFDPQSRGGARSRGGILAAMTIGCFLATFINPYGPGLYRLVFQLLGDHYFMDLHTEWQSPDFHGAGSFRYEMLILLTPALLALSARRPHLVELALAVIWLHFALASVRYVALWVVIAGPLLARSFVAIPYLQDLARRILEPSPDSAFVDREPVRLSWAWTLVFAVGVVGGSYFLQGKFAHHKQKNIASHALDRVLELQAERSAKEGHRSRIFHGYNWGGYLTWHGWPAVYNWIDDRNEVQGRPRIELYFDTINTKDGWEQTLAEVELVCLPPDTPLTRELCRRPHEWRERFRDDDAVVFERAGEGRTAP
jgi:hypothetical protein